MYGFALTRGTGTACEGVCTNVGGLIGLPALPRSAKDGLPSRERSVRSSIAPFTSFTTTTGVSGLSLGEYAGGSSGGDVGE